MCLKCFFFFCCCYLHFLDMVCKTGCIKYRPDGSILGGPVSTTGFLSFTGSRQDDSPCRLSLPVLCLCPFSFPSGGRTLKGVRNSETPTVSGASSYFAPAMLHKNPHIYPLPPSLPNLLLRLISFSSEIRLPF